DVHCSCGIFEFCGIPCRHIFCILKAENQIQIPKSLILKRWTKDAKEFDPSSMGSFPTQQNISRFGFLVGQCSRMCHYDVS
ncbi:unnamed protein product, partial [Linum tenue]